MTNCIFCKIVNKEVPTVFLYEDNLVVAFKDIRPIAPVHVLVIPKKHIESVADFKDKDEPLAGRLVVATKKIAEQLGIAASGYKILFRVGDDGGQEVQHVHLHLLGGAKLSENIKPI